MTYFAPARENVPYDAWFDDKINPLDLMPIKEEDPIDTMPVSYTHLTLPTNREV